jgi:hypothetical protein
MRKEKIVALFAALVMLSTLVASASAFNWGPPAPPATLPANVVPYTVSIGEIYIHHWWGSPTYYKGVYVINMTAANFWIENQNVSQLSVSAPYMAGVNLVTYATSISVEGLVITPDILNPTTELELYSLIGDPVILPDVTLSMIAMTASNVTTTGFSVVPYPGSVKITSDSMTLSKYTITGTKYSGTPCTELTGNIAEKNEKISVAANGVTYSLSGPSAQLTSAVAYATSVSGVALGLLPLSWTGSNVPLLVSFAQLLLPTITMTSVKETVISLTAATVTMPTLKIDISA